MILRHGDLNFRTVTSLPKGKVKKVSSFTLAEGEYTGHNHNLVADKGASLAIVDLADEVFFEILGGSATLTHPEHKPIKFDTGTYHMKKEREFDYFTAEIRKVTD